MRTLSKIAVVATMTVAPLAACGGLGGGNALSDCVDDVPDSDFFTDGAAASYNLPVVSCSNDDDGGPDTDQYLYPEVTSDLTLTCTVEDAGEGDGVSLLVYRDFGNGDGSGYDDVLCSEAGAEVEVKLADLDPGDRVLIEVVHFGEGSRARVTAD